MSLSQALQHFLKANMVTLRDPPANPDTSSPKYNLNAKYAYTMPKLTFGITKKTTL